MHTITLPSTMTTDVRGTVLTIDLAAMVANGAALERAAYGIRKTIQDAHANAAFDTTEAMIRDKTWADVTLDAKAKPADVKKAVVSTMERAKAHGTWETRLARTAVALAEKAITALVDPARPVSDPFPVILSGRDKALADVMAARVKGFDTLSSADRAAKVAKAWALFDAGTAAQAVVDLCNEALREAPKADLDSLGL